MKVEHEFYVSLRDVNHLNELTNTGLLAYFEDTAGLHSAIAGNQMNGEHTWVLLNWKVQIIRRPKFNENIKVQTWSQKIDRFYAYRDFRALDEEGNIVCVASSKWVYIDLSKGKIIKVPEDVASSYEVENDYAFNEKEIDFKKLTEPSNYSSVQEFKVMRNMIDSNHHLNNIYYLDIAKEALPKEIYINGELNYFEVMYKKEIKCGEVVKAFYSFENGNHIVVVKNYNEDEIHAIIKLK